MGRVTDVSLQNRDYTKSGRVITCQWYNSAIYDEQGNLLSIFSFGQDISDRVAVGNDLRRTRQWLDRFSEHSPSEIFTIVQEPDNSVRFEYMSGASESINEIPVERVLEDSNSLLELHHPDDRSSYFEAVARSAGTMEMFSHQWRIITPSGKLKWLQVKSRPERRENGAIAQYGVAVEITEQKRIERDLQQAIQQIDTHFENSPLAIFHWAIEGRVLRWSRQAERIFGWTAEYMQTLTRDFVYAEDRQRVFEAVAPLLRGEVTGISTRDRNYTKDGRVVTREWDISAIPDETGECSSILRFARDITAQVAAENELKRQRELREAIFNESADALFLVAPETLLVSDCNRRAAELFEVESREEPIGIEGRTLQKRPFTDDEIADIVRQMERDGYWSMELEYIGRKGRVFWGNIAAKPVEIGDRSLNPVRVSDITGREQAEESLRESEERFRRAFEDAGIGVALVALDGKFLRANRFLQEMLGYSERELQTKTFQAITHPDDLPVNLERRRGLLSGESRTYRLEKRYFNASGAIVRVAMTVSTIADRDGNPLYFVVQVQDIGDRYRPDRLKDEFIPIVGHELRTPLTSIRGSLGILATDALDNDPETADRLLRVALKSSERLARLVDDILDLERLDSGRIPPVLQDRPLGDIVTEAVEAVGAIAATNRVAIAVDFPPIAVRADGDAIIRTLTNLLDNAIKFSLPNGNVRLQVTARGRDPNGEEAIDEREQQFRANRVDPYLLFSVSDRGRGIPSDKLESIFGRFQQVDASDARAKGGTGLGLAICRSIVRQHGGDIRVESQFGEGSTFYFTLPG